MRLLGNPQILNQRKGQIAGTYHQKPQMHFNVLPPSLKIPRPIEAACKYFWRDHPCMLHEHPKSKQVLYVFYDILFSHGTVFEELTI